MSGQEKLPVLQLPNSTTIAGSSNIIAWAKENTLLANSTRRHPLLVRSGSARGLRCELRASWRAGS